MKEALQPGVRVTLELGEERMWMQLNKGPLAGKRQQALVGRVVLPGEPRARSGTYWGYSVRIAAGLGEALSASPYEVWCLHCGAFPFCVPVKLFNHDPQCQS